MINGWGTAEPENVKKLPLVCKRFPCQWNYSGAGRRPRLLLSLRNPEAELRIERVCGCTRKCLRGCCHLAASHLQTTTRPEQTRWSVSPEIFIPHPQCGIWKILCYFAFKSASAFAPWQIIFLAENLHRQSLPVLSTAFFPWFGQRRSILLLYGRSSAGAGVHGNYQ